jgi:hypothetical protein
LRSLKEQERGGKKAKIWTVRIGHVVMMTWPGEPTTSLGLALKDFAYKVGAKKAWVLGLTNDHLSYFTTPEEYAEGGYEACMTFFGRNSSVNILEAHQLLLSHQQVQARMIPLMRRERAVFSDSRR